MHEGNIREAKPEGFFSNALSRESGEFGVDSAYSPEDAAPATQALLMKELVKEFDIKFKEMRGYDPKTKDELAERNGYVRKRMEEIRREEAGLARNVASGSHEGKLAGLRKEFNTMFEVARGRSPESQVELDQREAYVNEQMKKREAGN